MSPLNRMVTYVKTAWGKEPVIVSSLVIAIVAAALPWVSPYTRYSTLMNERMPYHYPVPVRDDGNMQDIPAHPCDKEGDQLDWLKK
ncbi:NADH dehydrogenase [ubiquinone] 1 alpha subcomplex subunit 3 isoform X1 [Pantherophis guttatus]|uniref:NADH dehydrogenase [ubiquinone] 1 alpha subcomplex subunit 3 n=1 Tax=Pantherophis guttatus TaxID=94885 RepID=A0A6P9BZ09_PANGU|nr:NADH dehydrogenase [ubiquinone] 1 alpha subcomplex subunit 3 isoform X1 [Pantherophis guttatus]